MEAIEPRVLFSRVRFVTFGPDRSALNEMQFIKEGETEETRDKRLNTLLAEAISGMDEAMVAITLENVGDDIETVFREMRNAFRGYTHQRSANKMYAGSFTQEDFDKGQAKVTECCENLTSLMQEHLNQIP